MRMLVLLCVTGAPEEFSMTGASHSSSPAVPSYTSPPPVVYTASSAKADRNSSLSLKSSPWL